MSATRGERGGEVQAGGPAAGREHHPQLTGTPACIFYICLITRAHAISVPSVKQHLKPQSFYVFLRGISELGMVFRMSIFNVLLNKIEIFSHSFMFLSVVARFCSLTF